MPEGTELTSKLATAARHVAYGRLIVSEQRERVARLRELGYATANYEKTLRVFEDTLQILEDHERLIRQLVEENDATEGRQPEA